MELILFIGKVKLEEKAREQKYCEWENHLFEGSEDRWSNKKLWDVASVWARVWREGTLSIIENNLE